ncbi:MAG: murein biosynthesis integral membrane protein MurJ [Sphaerochaetaceae bacterium]|nr:murein biosynthesis integral membrane protein MurJ [Sphaerochaetaceae bacterium]
MEHKREDQKKLHTINSTIVMICTLLSRLLGIVKARVIAVHFGLTGIADVINFTFNIPNNFRKLFAEGALSNAYVPVFSLCIADDDQRTASRALLARMQGFQLLVFVPLILATWIFREHIVVFLSDFRDPDMIRLSSGLLVYFMIFLLTISFSAVYQGVLQCHGSFLVASAAPLAFSISVIGSIILLSESIGAYSMAVGTVLGGTLQCLITALHMRKFGYSLGVSFAFRDKRFKQVLSAWLPVTVGSILLMAGQQVAYYFASTLETGSVTAFSNAIIFWQTPYGIFFTAIATVYFPSMVAAAAKNDQFTELGSLSSQALSHVTSLLLPAAITLAFLREETVAAVLQKGLFGPEDTLRTAHVLLWYVIGMVPVAWFGILQRIYYAMFRFKRMVVVVVLIVAVDVIATWLLIRQGFDARALSMANTIAYATGCIVVFLMAPRPLMRRLRQSLIYIIRIMAANIPLVVLGLAYDRFAPDWAHNGGTALNLLILAGLYAVAVAITIAIYRIARIEWIGVLKKSRH